MTKSPVSLAMGCTDSRHELNPTPPIVTATMVQTVITTTKTTQTTVYHRSPSATQDVPIQPVPMMPLQPKSPIERQQHHQTIPEAAEPSSFDVILPPPLVLPSQGSTLHSAVFAFGSADTSVTVLGMDNLLSP